MSNDTAMSGTLHKFEVGTELEECPAWEWKISNRMLDVDTGEVLYRLQGIRKGLNEGRSRTVTESTLETQYADTDMESEVEQ